MALAVLLRFVAAVYHLAAVVRRWEADHIADIVEVHMVEVLTATVASEVTDKQTLRVRVF